MYTQNYYSIDWPAQRSYVNPVDLYTPHSYLLEGLYKIIDTYEQCVIPPLRRAGIRRAYELCVLEDENTDCQDLGPVNKMMNQIVRVHAEGRASAAAQRHAARCRDFLWLGAEGMMMCGTNGSQLWDIAFAGQALVEPVQPPFVHQEADRAQVHPEHRHGGAAAGEHGVERLQHETVAAQRDHEVRVLDRHPLTGFAQCLRRGAGRRGR